MVCGHNSRIPTDTQSASSFANACTVSHAETLQSAINSETDSVTTNSWLSSIVVGTSDSGSKDHEFDSRSVHCQVA